MQLGLKDFKRFEKQIILKKVGVAGQKKIINAKVLIIGVGGLGCPLLTYLAASGVGTIGIVDPDKIEISNLNRQTLFTTNDIGKDFFVSISNSFAVTIFFVLIFFWVVRFDGPIINVVLIPSLSRAKAIS